MHRAKTFRLEPSSAKVSQKTGQIMCRIHETGTTAATEKQPRSVHEMGEVTLPRFCATRFRRWSSSTRRDIRRIADDQIRGAAIRFCRLHHVVFNQARFVSHPIFVEIFRAEVRSVAVDLDERHMRCMPRAEHGDADCAGPRAEIERSARDFCRPRKASEMERVDIRAIPRAALRLMKPSFAPACRVDGLQKNLIFARDGDRGTKGR